MHFAETLIRRHRLVAILRLTDLTDAVPLAKTLVAAGVKVLEFTLTNRDAPDAIRRCLESIPEFQSQTAAIGMGSVRDESEADQAIGCGSQFVVSPTTCPRVIERCLNAGIPACPGAFTPTEIYSAHRMGANIVKVFPARALGPEYIKDLLAPMPFLSLMPTGGIDAGNVADYYRAGAVAVGVGGLFLDPKDLAENNWPSISRRAHEFANLCLPKPT